MSNVEFCLHFILMLNYIVLVDVALPVRVNTDSSDENVERNPANWQSIEVLHDLSYRM